MVQECELRDFATARIVEAHRKYIDIQAPISEPETYGYGFLTERNSNQQPIWFAPMQLFIDRPNGNSFYWSSSNSVRWGAF